MLYPSFPYAVVKEHSPPPEAKDKMTRGHRQGDPLSAGVPVRLRQVTPSVPVMLILEKVNVRLILHYLSNEEV